MKKGHYLTISEFSRISEVSRQSLIFYDKIGLFSPKLIGGNGYRYYSHEQIYMIFVINILKELGTPLRTIKAYMQNITPTDAIGLLEQQDKVLTKKIADLKGFQDMLHVKVQNILQLLRIYPLS